MLDITKELMRIKEEIVTSEMRSICFNAHTKSGLDVREECILIARASEYAEKMILSINEKLKGN